MLKWNDMSKTADFLTNDCLHQIRSKIAQVREFSNSIKADIVGISVSYL